jgi:hypothetical protein
MPSATSFTVEVARQVQLLLPSSVARGWSRPKHLLLDLLQGEEHDHVPPAPQSSAAQHSTASVSWHALVPCGGTCVCSQVMGGPVDAQVRKRLVGDSRSPCAHGTCSGAGLAAAYSFMHRICACMHLHACRVLRYVLGEGWLTLTIPDVQSWVRSHCRTPGRRPWMRS